MRPERLIDCIGYIDDDLVLRAETRACSSHHRISKRVITVAACLAVVLLAGFSAGYASGLFGGLDSYFGGEAETYLDEILSAVTSVSNDEMELRIDGAVADGRSCHLVVSFVGLTDETKQRFSAGKLEEQQLFDFYAVTESGERVDFTSRESGTYTEADITGKKAKTMLADADMTYLLTGYIRGDTDMHDIEKVCFSFEELTLEVDIQQHIAPEIKLYPEDPENASAAEFYISRIGFYFTVPAGEEEDHLKLYLIKTDKGLEEMGYSASGGTFNDRMTWIGYWGGGSSVSVGLIDLDDFCGIQVNGENYYFAESGQ